MLKKIITVYALALAVLASGCVSVPMASPERDSAAKTFTVKPDKANIYVYRNETLGAAMKMPIVLNGKLVADTASMTYLLLEVPPGSHKLVSKTENDATLMLNADAGRNYFIWQEAKMGGFAPRSALHLVDESTGKAGIKECKLIEVAQ